MWLLTTHSPTIVAITGVREIQTIVRPLTENPMASHTVAPCRAFAPRSTVGVSGVIFNVSASFAACAWSCFRPRFFRV